MGSLEGSNQNEYVGTALQIFDFCGVRSTGTLSVKALMDKISASEKSSNRSEYKHLKNILDPDECNPDIDVTKLTDALHKYSETQKVKVDLEDSFNLKSGGVPQDTDYGISNDGFQLLEELQCELREKSLLTGQLRDQIYYMEQQNEELLSGLTSERDALKAQIVLLREEKQKYLLVSHDYEEACQRLASIESDFEQTRRELDGARKNSKLLQDCVDQLQVDNHSLEEQLLKSKEECHRINEMYASRQAFLLLQNETLKSEHAEITNKYDDQQHVIQKIVQEKSILEMELKDILNKSDESPRFDRTIDVSYTDEQMLTTLDGLTADSKFGQLLVNTSTQVDQPCETCDRNVESVPRKITSFFWNATKSLFQIFAVLCFCMALLYMYNVTQQHSGRECRRGRIPWNWLSLQDLLDLALRIEYVGEIPM